MLLPVSTSTRLGENVETIKIFSKASFQRGTIQTEVAQGIGVFAELMLPFMRDVVPHQHFRRLR